MDQLSFFNQFLKKYPGYLWECGSGARNLISASRKPLWHRRKHPMTYRVPSISVQSCKYDMSAHFLVLTHFPCHSKMSRRFKEVPTASPGTQFSWFKKGSLVLSFMWATERWLPCWTHSRAVGAHHPLHVSTLRGI